MYVTIKLTPETPLGWEDIFENFSTVDRIEYDLTDDEAGDITVFYKDSEEPFPLSSLRPDSPLKIAIKAKL